MRYCNVYFLFENGEIMKLLRLQWVGIAFLLMICFAYGYNHVQTKNEEIKAMRKEMVNQYQHRTDLILKLVKIVETYAPSAKNEVTQARLVAMRQVSPQVLTDRDEFDKFKAKRNELDNALSRLTAVSCCSPGLQADRQIKDLQVQLESIKHNILDANLEYIDMFFNYQKSVIIYQLLVFLFVISFLEFIAKRHDLRRFGWYRWLYRLLPLLWAWWILWKHIFTF